MLRRRAVRRPLAVLLGAVLLGACAASPPAAVPAYRIVEVRLPLRQGKAPRLVLLHGQLLWLPQGVALRYDGRPLGPVQRAGAQVRMGKRLVALDLTGLDPAEALRVVRLHPRIPAVQWRGLAEISGAVREALGALRAERITLSIELSLTASRGFNLRRLAPVCSRLQALRVVGAVQPGGLRWLRRCPHLRAVVLRGALSPHQLVELSALRQIWHLDLSGTLRLFGPGADGLRPLGRLWGLVSLDLSANGLQDRDLAPLKRLRRLHWLGLADNPIRGVGLGRLGRLPRLAYLDLSETRLSPKGLARLAGLRSLRWVRLGGTPLRRGALRAFSRARPKVALLGGDPLREAGVDGGRGQWGLEPGGGRPAVHPRIGFRPRRVSARRPWRPRKPLPRLGVASCDRYLRAYQCVMRHLLKTVPNGARLLYRQLRRLSQILGRMSKAKARATCSRLGQQLRRIAKSRPVLRHCLKP